MRQGFHAVLAVLLLCMCQAAYAQEKPKLDKAEDVLRKSMKGKLDSKTDKPQGEGRVTIAVGANSASIVELRCNTDFTAKNDLFVKLTDDAAAYGLTQPAGPVTLGGAPLAALEDLRIKTGETIAVAQKKLPFFKPGLELRQRVDGLLLVQDIPKR